MNKGISRKEARRTIAAVEKARKAGHKAPFETVGKGEQSAIIVAAAGLGISPSTLRDRIGKGGPCERQHGLKVNWDVGAPKAKPVKSDPPVEVPTEPIALRRKANKAESRALEAERRAIAAESLRESVFRLSATPLDPPSWPAPKFDRGGKHPEAIILFISDIHMGEVISLDQMGGRNSYNKLIAGKRIARLFQSVVSLGTEHWSGLPPAVIYVVLGGDLVSGEIHEELAKTNDLLAIPAVRELSGHLITGLNLLLENFSCPINVLSVPGNHGRTTRKPEAKGFALDSYDTLL